MNSLTPSSGSDDGVAASSELRKRFADAILEWLDEQGYNDEDADAILRAIFDRVNRADTAGAVTGIDQGAGGACGIHGVYVGHSCPKYVTQPKVAT